MTAGQFWRRMRVHMDWSLVLVTLLIAGIGLVNLYSATRHFPERNLFGQQVVWLTIGLGAMIALTVVDYRVWSRVAWLGLAIWVAAVIFVHVDGIVVKGSRRWIGHGSARLQPSEFIKVAVIVALARFVQDRAGGPLPWPRTLVQVSAFAGAVFFIAWQPDLGTASLTALICLSVAFVTARHLWPLAVGLGVLLVSIPPMWAYVLHDYQKRRVLTFLDPSSDPTGAGWHARQSILAVGSGRWGGKGYMDGTQNQLNFLPEQWTDFPFSVLAEEWGFVGGVGLIGCYAFLVLRILHVASQARDRFGAVICVGAAALVFWHTLVNIAMVTGLAPVVGVTLPLVSYGGSSVLTVMLALGLVGSVSLRRYVG